MFAGIWSFGELHHVQSRITEPLLSDCVEPGSGSHGGGCRNHFQRRAEQAWLRKMHSSSARSSMACLRSCHPVAVRCQRLCQSSRGRGDRRSSQHGHSGQQAHSHHAKRCRYQLFGHQLAEFFDSLGQHNVLPAAQRHQHLHQPGGDEHAITAVRHPGQQRQTGAGEPVRYSGGRWRGRGYRRFYGIEPAYERCRRAGRAAAVW